MNDLETEQDNLKHDLKCQHARQQPSMQHERLRKRRRTRTQQNSCIAVPFPVSVCSESKGTIVNEVPLLDSVAVVGDGIYFLCLDVQGRRQTHPRHRQIPTRKGSNEDEPMQIRLCVSTNVRPTVAELAVFHRELAVLHRKNPAEFHRESEVVHTKSHGNTRWRDRERSFAEAWWQDQ